MNTLPLNTLKPGLRRSHRALLTLVAVAALSACGGGGGDTAPATAAPASAGALSFASSMASQASAAATADTAGERKTRLSVAAVNGVDANLLLDWAEYKYADLFPKARVKKFPLTYLGKNYSVREYTSGAVTRYLGITDTGEVYGLGDFTNNALQSFGVLADFAAQVLVDRCGVNATLCNNPPSAGPLNVCAMPVAQFLAAGSRFDATYVLLGDLAAETVSESVVEGPGTFENQSATKVRSTTRTTSASGIPGVPGISITTNTNTYFQAANGGLTRTLGLDGSTVNGGLVINGIPIGGTTTTLKTVFDPADLNLQFTLAQGQSMTKYTTAISTVSGVTVTLISGTTYTFEGLENITVQGKTYATCRYQETAQDSISGSSTVWYIQGKGVPARSVSVSSNLQSGTSTTTTELKSGSINGQPL